MAKQGQHRNDAHDSAKSKGPNKPKKSATITTGTYKLPCVKWGVVMGCLIDEEGPGDAPPPGRQALAPLGCSAALRPGR